MTFPARSIDALKAYLRTAAVIDDAALTTQPKESVSATTLQTPGRGVQASQQPEEPGEFKGARLAVPPLVDAFLEQGILCTVFGRKEVLTNNIDALLRSDILVVDWILFDGDDGSMTANFIHECTVRHPHALHMICIYTSANDLGAIEQKLRDFSPNLKKRQDSPLAYSLGSTYVLIVDKGHREEALPKLLLDAFAPLVGGLLRNAVFHSIGAIRTNTHALLNRFHPDLDPAFVTHRVYSNPCEDTEQHLLPLISSEISSILAQEGIPQQLNSEAIQCWLDSGSSRNNNSGIPQAIKDIINQKRADILQKGIMSIQEIKKHSEIKRILKESLLTAFWGAKDGTKSDAMLAMLMACEHRYSTVEPMLKSGTILKLKDDKKYFLCIQPPCDCVRIESEGRPFIFAHVSRCKKKDKFNFTVMNQDGTITYLAKDSKAYKASLIKFKPDAGKTYISAKEDSGKWLFTDIDGNQYELLFQLNELHALRTIQECSNNLSRIGLMESDWQRRCTMGEHQ